VLPKILQNFHLKKAWYCFSEKDFGGKTMTVLDLKSLSDHELHAHIRELLSQKRTTDLKLIKALIVMRNNQAFQRAGFFSLSEYMRDALGFSRDESWKTSQAVEVICKSKRAWELLESGQTYISHLAMLNAKLTDENADQIFDFLPEKSRRELEGFLSSIDQHGNRTTEKPMVKLVLNCPPELIEKIEHLSKLRSHASHKGEWASVLAEAVDLMIDKTDPAKKAERAVARQIKQPEGAYPLSDCDGAVTCDEEDNVAAHAVDSAKNVVPSADALQTPACTGAVKTQRTRAHIPAAVRHKIFLKYQSQCCFVGHDGRRCSRRAGLQIDHIQPVSRGGSNHPDNLRLLCAIHNRTAAAQLFGRDFMMQKYQDRYSESKR
jgi:hypothetical protein